MLNEHGQRSSLTIDYSNPLTSESDEKGICTATVKVMNKENELMHECVGRRHQKTG